MTTETTIHAFMVRYAKRIKAGEPLDQIERDFRFNLGPTFAGVDGTVTGGGLDFAWQTTLKMA